MSFFKFNTQAAAPTGSGTTVVLWADSTDTNSQLKFVDTGGVTRLATARWDAVPQTVLPKTDNTYDLGSATFGWRTLNVKGVTTLGGQVVSNTPVGTAALLKAADTSGVVLQAQRSDTTQAATLSYTGAGAWSVVGVLGLGNAATFIDKGGDVTTTLVKAHRSDATQVATIDYNGAGSFNITGTALGIGTTSPQGRLHGYDTESGFLFWRGSVNATPQTIIASGIASGAQVMYYIYPTSGGGPSEGGTGYTKSGTSLTLATASGNGNPVLSVSAGALSIVRNSGGGTVYAVALWIVYV